jgi:hypothetical protein
MLSRHSGYAWQSRQIERIQVVRLALIVIALLSTMTLSRAVQEAPIWFWFATCGGPAMTLEVRFDKTTLEKVTVPLCRALRNSLGSQGEAARIEFAFTPSRAIRWSGDREINDRTRAGQLLEVNLWQAGADPEALTIGVSVMTRDRILMNTVHIAHSDRRDQSTLASGLTLATYPATR